MSESSEEKVQPTGTCAICGDQYHRFGNNPEPMLRCEERVCDECNDSLVIPARMGAKVNITTYDNKIIRIV